MEKETQADFEIQTIEVNDMIEVGIRYLLEHVFEETFNSPW